MCDAPMPADEKYGWPSCSSVSWMRTMFFMRIGSSPIHALFTGKTAHDTRKEMRRPGLDVMTPLFLRTSKMRAM
jgi:hypothetical protein